MTSSESNASHTRRVAAEIVELGETLFDTLLDAVPANAGNEESEPLPKDELRTAAEEFFQTLRTLLCLPSTSITSGIRDPAAS